MRCFFRAHRLGAPRRRIPQARLLRDASAGFNHADVPLDLIFQRACHVAKRIEILHFGLGAELLRAAQSHTHIAVTAQRPSLHIAIAYAGVFERLLQRGKVGIGFGGRAHVRLADDFAQRHAAAIEIDQAIALGIGHAIVQVFRGVLFHMQPRNPYAQQRIRSPPARFRIRGDLHPALRGQRQFVL